MATDTTGTPFDAMTAPLQAMSDGVNGQFGELMKANAEASRKCMEGFGRISREIVDFSSNRLQEDMQLMQRLACCKDPGEAMQLHSESLNRMIKDYMDEVQRLCALASETGSSCLSSIDGGVPGAAADPKEQPAKTAQAAE